MIYIISTFIHFQVITKFTIITSIFIILDFQNFIFYFILENLNYFNHNLMNLTINFQIRFQFKLVLHFIMDSITSKNFNLILLVVQFVYFIAIIIFHNFIIGNLLLIVLEFRNLLH